MGAVVDPFARCGDPLAGGDRGGVPDGGHQVAVPARLDAQNAEAVLAIMVGDALDETRQHLLCRQTRLWPQSAVHEAPSSVAVKNPAKPSPPPTGSAIARTIPELPAAAPVICLPSTWQALAR